MRKIVFIAFAVIFAGWMFCSSCEKQPSQNLNEDKGCSSQDWKEYDSLVEIWPQLKKEGIESISFRYPVSLEYGEDDEWAHHDNVNAFGYSERAANIVRWWPIRYKVPKENLPKCIKIINKAIKKATEPNVMIPLSKKMLIVTKKGKYIIEVHMFIFPGMDRPRVYGKEWVSDELGEFIENYCIRYYDHWYFFPPEEQTEAILIFSDRKNAGINDSFIVWPPVVLFGDEKEAEKLLGRSFEPKMVFEGREWLEKIVSAYESAMKEAKDKGFRRDSLIIQGWIVFLTQDEFYWGSIGIDGDEVVGEHIVESKQLKEYFDELGLTKELLAGEPNAPESIGDTEK